MKITKKQPVESCNDIDLQLPDEKCCTLDRLSESSECKYSAAIDLISAAIESLAEQAKDDEIAKDSIANLGVVMLDLKGSC